MMHVQGVVEIDAGENGEHIGLQERDQEFQPGERDHEAERGPAAENAEPTTKPPNTFSMVWPAIMLANRRTERLIGRVR